ncbi:GH3 auxin-responsive promoter family protein [uncultured Alistipes sp.]|uniref:GH3 auxin-responsive promoter family protein n=1 Tax=uncultured Alistipes sp. TaxID=538949 RepID=UPI0026128E79|nr:GH3 auxin-responsive promoter family protein [uncultured Alistipes sp.]
MALRSNILRTLFSLRLQKIDRFRRHPAATQREMLHRCLADGSATAFGREFGLQAGWDYERFARAVPAFDYERFKPYVERMMRGERSVTAPGRVDAFARSSGTTSDRSKYIPVTGRSIIENHTRGMRDVVSLYHASTPGSRVLDGRILTLGGSCRTEQGNLVGDLSAVLLYRTARWSRLLCTPPAAEALIPDFDAKCEAICRSCSREDVRAFTGVPSWNLELMRRIVAFTGRANLREVWPNLECFAHGGVSFAPYRDAFEELIPGGMRYMETYNASEGFFAIADDPARDDMLLMLDYGTFYEFRRGTEIVPLEGVRAGETYAMLVTSDNGLWRYEIGDTVTFTSTDPYRIRFAGRTRQFLNVFGEEVIVDNAERALTEACRRTGAQVEEYTVAPRFMTLERSGAHEWWVEFRREPDDRERFAGELDEALRRINSDYDAKRRTTLERLSLNVMAPGSFLRWMRRTGKNKVPRMAGDRRVAEEIARIAASPLRAEGR